MKLEKEDLVNAENLTRESLRIRTKLFGNLHLEGYSGSLLASILLKQGKLGYETKELLEKSLALDIKNCGPEGSNTAQAFWSLGDYYYLLAEKEQTDEAQKEHLRLSKVKYEEALRIYTKIKGSGNSDSMQLLSILASVSRKLEV